MSYRACLSGPKVLHTDNVCHLPLYLVEPGLIPHPSVAGPKEALGERPQRISRGVSQRAALQWFCCAEGPATSPPVTSADSHSDLGRAALPWLCLGLASGSLPWLPAPAAHRAMAGTGVSSPGLSCLEDRQQRAQKEGSRARCHRRALVTTRAGCQLPPHQR